MPPPNPPKPTGNPERDFQALREWGAWHWTTYSWGPQAQALKEAAKEVFALEADVWNPEDAVADPDLVARFREILPRVYRETQQSLQAAGMGSQIPLLRGVKLPPDVKGYFPTAVEGWTTDRKWASRFAEEPEGDILEADIPTERVIMWHGGPGWKQGPIGPQSEFMVLSEAPS